MYIKLLTVKQIEVAGVPKTYHPGDWVDVGKHSAMRWIADGSATVADYNKLVTLQGVGIVLLDDKANAGAVLSSFKKLEHTTYNVGNPLPYRYTVMIGGGIKLRPGLLPAAVKLLGNWQVASPLVGYSDRDLAVYAGSGKQRVYVLDKILDLRVPMYDTRLTFVKRCADTRTLFEHWQQYQHQVSNKNLAFLCALWDVKPLICALPTVWKGKGK